MKSKSYLNFKVEVGNFIREADLCIGIIKKKVAKNITELEYTYEKNTNYKHKGNNRSENNLMYIILLQTVKVRKRRINTSYKDI